ncbi:MAG: hypothetical protein RJB39_738 [Candidatus Parcubacteria bacterium]
MCREGGVTSEPVGRERGVIRWFTGFTKIPSGQESATCAADVLPVGAVWPEAPAAGPAGYFQWSRCK